MRPILIDMPMPIITPRLMLRPPVMGYSDAYNYVEVVSESLAEFSQWLGWASYVPSIESTEDYLRECCANWIIKTNNGVGMPLCIIDRETEKFLGMIVLHNVNWDFPRFEFGYWIRTSYAGKGLMSETVNALTRYCFLELKAKRIEIRCEVDNARSKKVPERLGYQLEARLRMNQFSVKTGEMTDTFVFARTDLEGLPDLEVRW